ncbi:MAG: ABC transporter substrate-binding protein [Rhodoferax sp.]|nr:ABC transporter substrate-binding protein [Rhodoferax sp.]
MLKQTMWLFQASVCAAMLVWPLLCTAQPPGAVSRLARIQAAQQVRVCIWPDYYGITYRNPKTNQLSGVDIDMAQALGNDQGAAVVFVDSYFAKLADDVIQDRCDVAMFAVGITPARQEKLRFTPPHLASDIYGMVSKANRRIQRWDDIDKSGVAVAKGTLHEPVMRNRLKAAHLLILDTPFAREQEVQSGRADVFMTDFPYSQRFLAKADWAQLLVPPGTYHITPYAYAMAPGDDAWHARLTQFVFDIKRDGRLMNVALAHQLDPIVAP